MVLQLGGQNGSMPQALVDSTHSFGTKVSSRPSRFIENFPEDFTEAGQVASSSTFRNSGSLCPPASGDPEAQRLGEVRQSVPSKTQSVPLPTPEASVLTPPNPGVFDPGRRRDTRQSGNTNICRLPTPPSPGLLWPELGHPTAGPTFHDQPHESDCICSTASISSEAATADGLGSFPLLTRQRRVSGTPDVLDDQRFRSGGASSNRSKGRKPPSWSRIEWNRETKEPTQLGLLFDRAKHWVCRSFRFGSHKLNYLRRRAMKVNLANGQHRLWDDVAPDEVVMEEIDVRTGVKITVTASGQK